MEGNLIVFLNKYSNLFELCTKILNKKNLHINFTIHLSTQFRISITGKLCARERNEVDHRM